MNVGIIGSGQLGWMTIIEGRKLPNNYYILDESAGPAARVADGYFAVGSYRDFVERCDVITYEFEHVNEQALMHAYRSGKLLPGMKPIELKRERILEKEYLRDEGFPVADFYVAKDAAEARRLATRFESAVIKSSRGGYDGKGQFYTDRSNAEKLEIGMKGKFVVEERIDFEAEASIIASRSPDGTFRAHRPSFNFNKKGMLFYNMAPYRDFGMRKIASSLLERLGYVGVMGIEFFIRDGKPMINEIAPRVHNTGHHTLHGSSISQFEQHLRAITGLPVPEPELFVPSGVLNIIGVHMDREMEEKILSVPGTALYWYGKEGIRRRRKVGHVNVMAKTTGSLRKRMEELTETVYAGRPEDYL